MNKLHVDGVRKAVPADAGAEVSDEWLFKGYLDGHETCLAMLVRRYERELFSYLRRVTNDAGLAEDVFQNTFLQVHLKRHMYEEGRPFRPWLYTIATNQAIDAMRRNKRHQRPSLDDPSRARFSIPARPLHGPCGFLRDRRTRTMVCERVRGTRN